MINYYIDAGSQVLEVSSASKDVHVTTLRLPDGNITILIVNRGTTDSKIELDFGSNLGLNLHKTIYPKKPRNPHQGLLLESNERWDNVGNSIIDTIAPNSFTIISSRIHPDQIEISPADAEVDLNTTMQLNAGANHEGTVNCIVSSGSAYGNITADLMYHAPDSMPPNPEAIIRCQDEFNNWDLAMVRIH